MTDGTSEIPEIGPEEASARIAAGAFVLDVREPDEFEAGHAPGAHHIPLGELAERADEIPTGVPIVCV